MLLVGGAVEPVEAEMRLRVERPDPGRGGHGETRGGVHRNVERDEARPSHRILIERVDCKVQTDHVVAGVAQPGGRLRQPERLVAKLVGGDQQNVH